MQLVDNLDGHEIEAATEARLAFTLDQPSYEFNPSAQHGEQLRAVLQPYAERARKVRTIKRRRRFPLRE